MTDLGRRPASDLIGLLADGEVSSREIVGDFVSRYERFNPAINAIIEIDADAALKAATESDLRRKAGESLGPLDGLPITVKDNIHVRGLGARWGSRLFADHRPEVDDIAIERLRAGGANLLAKTNTPEFALAAHTDNLLHGPTRNPWRLDLTPGGSSGGAVAALAAGIGPLAIGTDAGGSIRRPASYAGVVGFRPSTGRIPRGAGFPALAMDFQVVAPAARTVADTYSIFRLIAGPDPRDRSSLAFNDYPLPMQLAEGQQRRLRICYVPDVEGCAVDREVHDQVHAAALTFSALGHHVESGAMPFVLADIERIWSTLTAVSLARVVGLSAESLAQVSASSRASAQRGATVSAQEYSDAVDAIQKVRRGVDAFFSRFDVLLSPASASLPWAIGQAFAEVIDGREAGPRSAAVFATFVNVAGIPAISLPAGRGASRLPIGLQLAGAFGRDLQVLGLAMEYESASPWQLLADTY
ncbi:amidase [Variovorax sp. LjRoot84]|uniref:amidase n=1 Tax=Variovorax sp. LjRoot84 TaxID=3342340 RepID=UPI003ECE69AB